MNNYPERMFFEEKIQEIETERDMLKGQVLDLDQVIKELKAENKAIRKMLLAGSPPYYEKWQKLREAAADVYDWAVLHGIEMEGKGVWYRLKQALEKPDEMA